jgi:hypothetical protein
MFISCKKCCLLFDVGFTNVSAPWLYGAPQGKVKSPDPPFLDGIPFGGVDPLLTRPTQPAFEEEARLGFVINFPDEDSAD